jgi:hypothetical protein
MTKNDCYICGKRLDDKRFSPGIHRESGLKAHQSCYDKAMRRADSALNVLARKGK